MKQVLEPVVSVSRQGVESTAIAEPDNNSASEDISRLQTQRSYLPDSLDKPVHKCGCT
jgi:hypothetical protein